METEAIIRPGDQIRVILQPLFGVNWDVDHEPTITFLQLPIPVQEEVVRFFQSSHFLHTQVEQYALSNFTGVSSCDACPTYSVKVGSVDFQLVDDNLEVILVGSFHLSGTPSRKACCGPLTLDDLEYLPDGFHKMSFNGPLVPIGYRYIGENDDQYSVYLPRDRISYSV